MAVAAADVDGRDRRHAPLTLERQLDRRQVGQRLGGEDGVAAILVGLAWIAIAHRRRVVERQPQTARVVDDVTAGDLAAGPNRPGEAHARRRARHRRPGTIRLLQQQHEAGDGTPGCEPAGSQALHQAVEIRRADVDVPRHDDQFVERVERGQQAARWRRHDDGRSGGRAPRVEGRHVPGLARTGPRDHGRRIRLARDGATAARLKGRRRRLQRPHRRDRRRAAVPQHRQRQHRDPRPRPGSSDHGPLSYASVPVTQSGVRMRGADPSPRAPQRRAALESCLKALEPSGGFGAASRQS